MAENEVKRLSEITDEDVNRLRRKTAQALPDSPASIGMRAAAVKPHFYGAITDDDGSLVAFLKRVIAEANEALRLIREKLDDDIEKLEDHEASDQAHKELFDKKVDEIGEFSHVYITDSKGVAYSLPYSIAWSPNTFPVRDEKGTFRVCDPKQDQEPVTKAYFDNVLAGQLDKSHNTSSSAHKALFDAKADANKSALRSILGYAKPGLLATYGLMSAEQANQLNTLVSLLDDNDADTTIDTIKEVLNAFANTQEGTDIANALAGKLPLSHDEDEDAHQDLFNKTNLKSIIGDASDTESGLMTPEHVDSIGKKLPISTAPSVVYATDPSGKQMGKSYTDAANADTLMLRDESGRARVADAVGTDNDYVANVRTVERMVKEHGVKALEELTAGVSRNDKRITNLEHGLSEDRFQTDAGVAYAKNIPENVLPYAAISKIGGMTRKCTNLLDVNTATIWTTSPYAENERLKAERYEAGIKMTVQEDLTSNWSRVGYTLGLTKDFLGKTLTLSVGNITYSTVTENSIPTIGFGICKHDNYYMDTLENLLILKAERTSELTLSIPTDTDYITYPYLRVCFYPTYGGDLYTGDNIIYENIMVNDGDTVLPFEPYFEGLRSAPVTEVESVGINILDISSALNENLVDNGDGTYTLTRTSENGRFSNIFPIYIPSKAVVNCYMEIVDTNIEGVTRIPLQLRDKNVSAHGESLSLVNGGAYYAPNSDCYYGVLYINYELHVGSYVTFRKPMITYGYESTEYAPYIKRILPIPEAVQALDGYGEGVNDTCYNYIDWEKKQFVKRVGKVDMGTLNWSYSESNGRSIFLTDTIPDLAMCTNTNAVINAICPLYRSVSSNAAWKDMDMAHQAVYRNILSVVNNNYTDAATFKAAMSGVMLYYELATPEIRDISNILSDDNLIKVEGGGTITMVNENKYAVPSEIIYQMKEVAG